MPTDGVVLVSDNHGFAAEVRRLCAAADQSLSVVADRGALARCARRAAVLLVDAAAGDLPDLPDMPGAEVVVLTERPDDLDSWRVAVGVGARAVMTLPRDSGRLVDVLALARETPGAAGPLVAVLGASGGAGASTLAVALGLAAAADGRAATLVDFDARGGGLDLLVGLEDAGGLRWPDLAAARGVVPSLALRDRLPRLGSIAVLSCGRPGQADGADEASAEAVSAVVTAARRGNTPVVADLPRWPSAGADVVVAACDALVLVVRCEVRGVAAATAALGRVGGQCDDMRVVLRTDARSRLDPRGVMTALGQPIAHTVRTEPRLAAAADQGELHRALKRSRLGEAAARLWEQLTVNPVANPLDRASGS